MSSNVSPDGDNGNHQGHCSRCHRVWTLKERQGVCRWCGNSASCQSTTAKPRHIKSRSNGRLKQANGYDQLDGEWLAIAIENARLYQQVQDMAILQERERLAREMHDGMAQLLGYINTQTLAVKKLLSNGQLSGA
ncbi:MAG: hypothetical protein HYY41_01385 [Chloroflexi bacterium]|nr:hypothetical protein [Chloroflexota bacterium]